MHVVWKLNGQSPSSMLHNAGIASLDVRRMSRRLSYPTWRKLRHIRPATGGPPAGGPATWAQPPASKPGGPATGGPATGGPSADRDKNEYCISAWRLQRVDVDPILTDCVSSGTHLKNKIHPSLRPHSGLFMMFISLTCVSMVCVTPPVEVSPKEARHTSMQTRAF